MTQPYHGRFKCKEAWTFMHDAKKPRITTTWKFGSTIYGELDRPLAHQGLQEVRVSGR